AAKYCKLPVRYGPCKKKIPSFYYKWKAKQCLPFDYSGCGGNANRFKTIEECRRTCVG
uniref:Kunitz-type serine protease inhibitor homolog delta-dendrotoxin n=1 Tax=Dendroaspis angusticeps TaxID=8618 RepID=VKTHD_DENAN|nr:RecName: Full=Kunitz-type serine protease inhibitor homolog delta-dendrotoxin; Short=Delta-DTX; AltName: Full=Dendrotoxin delta-DaTX; AltName: Full=Protease inhibitor K; AltName: Full=Toxin C13S1C3; AltName: Full=Venom basic protease inhibitor K [Dendroaspis angusticeps]